MQRSIFVAIFTVFVVLVGCSKGPSKPEGMPELVPCKVKVVQDGSPLANANVVLIPVAPAGTVWPVGGQTDAAGIAEMRTYGEHVGAPVDHYKVVVSKVKVETLVPATTSADGQYQPAQEKLYDLVAPALGFPPTSTLEIQVVKGTTDYSVDVGVAVQVLKQQPNQP